MDLSAVLDQLQGLWSGATDIFAASPELAAVGFLIGIAVTLGFLVWCVSSLVGLLNHARRAASMRRIRALDEASARIVIAEHGFGRRRAITRFLGVSGDRFLKGYMFGGKFDIIRHPGGVNNEEQAAAFLKRSRADIVIWAEKSRDAKGGLACILSRPTRPHEEQRPASMLAIPKKKASWNDMLARAHAYAIAKQYRPALGRPQDFKPERLAPVVEMLLLIRDAKPEADQVLLSDIRDDATAGALQIAQADPAWVARAEQIARATLAEMDRSQSPDRWVNAKIALGRVLRLRADHQFDPVVLREAVGHLQEAMEALRSEPRLRLAESAAQAIADSQRLLSGQRKFSITGGGI